MESLGGDSAWFDRFVAFHAAIVYYWILILSYAISPKYAYHFSELIEGHAVDTYGGMLHASFWVLHHWACTVFIHAHSAPSPGHLRSSDAVAHCTEQWALLWPHCGSIP
jgi:hypothetical protein